MVRIRVIIFRMAGELQFLSHSILSVFKAGEFYEEKNHEKNLGPIAQIFINILGYG